MIIILCFIFLIIVYFLSSGLQAEQPIGSALLSPDIQLCNKFCAKKVVGIVNA